MRICSEVLSEITRSPGTRVPGVTFSMVGWMQDAAIDDRRRRRDHVQRRHRDAMAKGDGHHVDLAPYAPGNAARATSPVELDRRRLQQAEPVEEIALTLGAGLDRHLAEPIFDEYMKTSGTVSHGACRDSR